MSEELLAKGNLTKGQVIGDYEYFNIGSTTLGQLKSAGIVPDRDYGEYATRKPDRIVIKRNGSKNPSVIAVIEDKQGHKFRSEQDRQSTVEQCNDIAQLVGAKIGIATDSETFIWINPNQYDEANKYRDRTTGEERSYSYVKDQDDIILRKQFKIDQRNDESDLNHLTDSTRETTLTLESLANTLSSSNSTIKSTPKVDPLPLARKVWQDIWVATGKSPEKCLYNVVELFIFKFLSDLEVLREPDNFEYLHKLSEGRGSAYALDYYAKNCRPQIIRLFPKGEDHTTIINGTIFVDERGEANLSQATLFKNSLKKFKDFESQNGKFREIDKEFKTKLYENFLKQSEGLKSLGQYFTPRKVVRAIVEISGVDALSEGQSFCDPFCGVGGFVLEPINLYKTRLEDFVPRNGKIKPKISYRGYDKGFEKDEERTIILAKANMLIYLSEVVSKYNNLSLEFSSVFNDVFKLLKSSNLGTLGIMLKEEEKYDLILTNPPYVTSGKSTLTNEINADAKLKDFYKINGGGVEGLALEWIIRSLKPGGKAFVVIPDGILNRLNDWKLRNFILEECYLDGIVSLPAKTFFTTPKKTYILAITKKRNRDDVQTHPVFTYLVSNIGETLDVNRFEIPDNDLREMVSLFNQYKGAPSTFSSSSLRCKVQSLDKFDPKTYWSVDRWWSKDEKIELGIEEEVVELSKEEFIEALEEGYTEIGKLITNAKDIFKKKIEKTEEVESIELSLSDTEYFKLNIGKRVLNRDLFLNKDDPSAKIPVYSANVKEPFGFLRNTNISTFNNPYVLWGIDGHFDLSVAPRGMVFASTDHCGTIEILNDNILPEYIVAALNVKKYEYGFDRGLRSNLENMKQVNFPIPFKDDQFDVVAQRSVIDKQRKFTSIQTKFDEHIQRIEGAKVSLDDEFSGKEVIISEIFDFPSTNSKITKAFCNDHKGTIPVYASSKDGTSTLGHIQDNLPDIKYYEDCLSWNRNGSVGYVFIREGRFTTNEDHRVLLPKTQFKEVLSKRYLKHEIERKMFLNGYSFLDKVGSTKISTMTINIPVDEDGNYDFNKQEEVANAVERLNDLKFGTRSKLVKITESVLDIS